MEHSGSNNLYGILPNRASFIPSIYPPPSDNQVRPSVALRSNGHCVSDAGLARELRPVKLLQTVGSKIRRLTGGSTIAAQLGKDNAYYARSMRYFANTDIGRHTMEDWHARAISFTGRAGWPVGDLNAPSFVKHLIRLRKTLRWYLDGVMFLGRLRRIRRESVDILGLRVFTKGLEEKSPHGAFFAAL